MTYNPRPRRTRLEQAAYHELRRRVLERDGWKCQRCGAAKHLQVHHQRFRAHLGNDVEDNLITLCTECHGQMHQQS